MYGFISFTDYTWGILFIIVVKLNHTDGMNDFQWAKKTTRFENRMKINEKREKNRISYWCNLIINEKYEKTRALCHRSFKRNLIFNCNFFLHFPENSPFFWQLFSLWYNLIYSVFNTLFTFGPSLNTIWQTTPQSKLSLAYLLRTVIDFKVLTYSECWLRSIHLNSHWCLV